MNYTPTEPTNDELFAQLSANPTQESLNKLAVMRSKRFTFIGIEDF